MGNPRLTDALTVVSGARNRRIVLHAIGAFTLPLWVVLACLSRGPGNINLQALFTVIAGAWFALVLGWCAAEKLPGRDVILAACTWGLLFRIAGLFGAPILEDDWARYLWDGRQFALTGDPYARTPADHFADTSLPARFVQLLDEINHPDQPTVYGPVCQFAFLLSYVIGPGELWPLKILLLAADLLTLVLLLRLTTPRNALLYAWCPLLIQESAFSAHPELLWIAPMVLALHGISRHIWWQVGIGCGLAVAAKMFALLIVPFAVRGAGIRSWLLCGLTVSGCYGWFWMRGSAADLAALALMAQNWEFNSTLVAFAHQALGWKAARLLAGLLFAIAWLAIYLQDARKDRRELQRGDLLYGCFFVCSPIVNPWYLLALLPFVALRPSAWGNAALAVVTLSYAHGLHLAPGNPFAPYELPWQVRAIEISVVLLAVFGSWWWRRLGVRAAKRHGD